jgi:alpha-1,3-rhamnosyl/mannosyltransferase
LFHCPFYGLPYYQPVAMVVTIHDLTFEFAPHWYPLEKRVAFQRQARWAARTARRIIVHSEHVRSMVLERYGRYGASEECILVARMPVDPCFSPEPDGIETSLARLGLRRPYVVALGGTHRRQLPVAVAAWAAATKTIGAAPHELPLVVVGTEAPGAQEGVSFTGVLEDSDWAAVLAGASAFCCATLYEGYGLPTLEAAACGTPVVCARVGALPELLGDAAAWCDEPDAGALGAALAEVLADGEKASRLADAGIERVRALPGWSSTAAVTLRAYREALGA